MAFQNRLLSTLPTRTPDVEIIFHGQLLMRSDGTSCEVAINPLALNHQLTIEARTRVANQPDVIEMRHLGLLNFRNPEGMTIEVRPTEGTVPLAWNCISETAPDTNSGLTTALSSEQDFRWILNLEGNLFHNSTLSCPLFQNRQHVIRLQHGEYFFRTGVRAPAGLKYTRRPPPQNPPEFRRIGAIARASVFLNPSESIVIAWNDGTGERELPLGSVPNGFHEIYVEHTPLFLDPNVAIGHDELAEYYKVLDVPQASRFTFTTVRENPSPFDKGTPTIPCQIVRLDEPGPN